jgi:hypothetical protein
VNGELLGDLSQRWALELDCLSGNDEYDAICACRQRLHDLAGQVEESA